MVTWTWCGPINSYTLCSSPPRFGDTGLATLTYSFLQASAKVAHIYGTAGAITIDGMDCPDRLTVTRHDGSPPQVPCTAHCTLHWLDTGPDHCKLLLHRFAL